MGGNAVKDAGAIYIDELYPTIDKLSAELGIDCLRNNLLGSTGKKEYSGDVDIAFPDQSSKEITKYYNTLKEIFGIDNLRKTGSVIHLCYPIVNYDSIKLGRLPRTGKVQIDFNFGDVEWLKIFNYSPGDLSKFKGVHRNLCIAAILKAMPEAESPYLDSFGRSTSIFKYKWSPYGLVPVYRKSTYDNCVCHKKQKDVVIDDPVKEINTVARLVFKNKDAVPSDLDSVENILDAVMTFFKPPDQEKIFRIIAENFQVSIPNYENYPNPEVIKKYFTE